MKPELLHSLLSRAASEEIGLVINVNKPSSLQIELDNFKRLHPQPEFFDLIMAIPSTAETLFITHKSVELEL